MKDSVKLGTEFVRFLLYLFLLNHNNVRYIIFKGCLPSTRIFFLGTLFGITPALFIVVALGSGIEKIIEQNTKAPELFELLSSPEIYIPIIGFFCIFILTIILKKFLNK